MTRTLPEKICAAFRSLVFELVYLVWNGAASLIACVLSYMPVRKPLVEWSAIWAHGVHALERVILGLDYTMTGVENFPAAPFIAALQHQSAWETAKLLFWFKDSAVVMKAELLAIPLWGRAATVYGSIGVARSRKPEDLRRFIDLAKARVAARRNIVLFPQGTRSPWNAPAKLQRGFVLLYESLDIPIVPVTLDSGKYWAKKSFIKYPGVVNVVVHPPILPGQPRTAVIARLQKLYGVET